MKIILDTNVIVSGVFSAVRHFRFSRPGWAVRLGAGKYVLVPPLAGEDAFPEASRLVIARELMGDTPYFISYESAMEVT